MYYRLNRQAKNEMDNGNYKKAIELYEQDLIYAPNSGDYAALYCELGECYLLADPPYNNVNRAIELFNKAINMDFHFAKSWLAFCYIFGDGIPVNLQKAVDLLREADEQGRIKDDIDHFADFLLCHIVDLRILLELYKQGKTADVRDVLSDPRKRMFFTETITAWRKAGNRIEQDGLNRMFPSVYSAWKIMFSSVYYNSQYYKSEILEWMRYFHYKKGIPKAAIIQLIHVAPMDSNIALKIYDTAFECLVEINNASESSKVAINETQKSILNAETKTILSLNTENNVQNNKCNNIAEKCKVLTKQEAEQLKGKHIVIPYGYTEIGYGAFSGRGGILNGIESVSIPNSITRIGEKAFEACKKITSITIPRSVIYFGSYAFIGCPNLIVSCSGDSAAYDICLKDLIKVKTMDTNANPYLSQAHDANTQFNLGLCYYNGDGVKQDYAQAVIWFTKAALQGHAIAQNTLGLCYDFGNIIAQNYAQAAIWYRKAAEQGHTRAQCNMGWCYQYGKGVKPDIQQAIFWYTKAAEKGDTRAQDRLNQLNNQKATYVPVF